MVECVHLNLSNFDQCLSFHCENETQVCQNNVIWGYYIHKTKIQKFVSSRLLLSNIKAEQVMYSTRLVLPGKCLFLFAVELQHH